MSERIGADEGGESLVATPLTSNLGLEGDGLAQSTSKSPAFQFYPKDFLSDDKQVVMSALECGIYIRLMSHCWLAKAIPNDMPRLARLAGVSDDVMREAWPVIERCFRAKSATEWVHPRLDKERRKQAEYSAKQAVNGAMGGRGHKKAKPLSGESQMEATGKPNKALHLHLQSASPERTHTQPKRRMNPGAGAGTYQREHVGHAWCGATYRVCVPSGLHGDLTRKLGGVDPHGRLLAFYAATEAGLSADAPVPANIFKFWQAHYDTHFATTAQPTYEGPSAEMRRNTEKYADLDWPLPKRGATA